jgi:hypothetical protein
MNKIKLHLGCGNVRIDGFINDEEWFKGKFIALNVEATK